MKLPKDWKYDVLSKVYFTYKRPKIFTTCTFFGSLFYAQDVRNIYFYEETNPRKITVL